MPDQVTILAEKNFRNGPATNPGVAPTNGLGTDYLELSPNNWFVTVKAGGKGSARNSQLANGDLTPGHLEANEALIPALLTAGGAGYSSDLWVFATIQMNGTTFDQSCGIECRAVLKASGTSWWKTWFFLHDSGGVYVRADDADFGTGIDNVPTGINPLGLSRLVLGCHSRPLSSTQVQFDFYIWADTDAQPFDKKNPGSFTPLWTLPHTRTYANADKQRIATQPCTGGMMNYGNLLYAAGGFLDNAVGFPTPVPLAPGTVRLVNATSIGAVAKAGAATGGVGAVTYQWQKWNGVLWSPLVNGVGGASNTATNTLCLTNQTPGSTVRVRCAYTDTAATTVYGPALDIAFLASNYHTALVLGNSRMDKRWPTSNGSTNWANRAPSVAAAILRGQGKPWVVLNGANAGRRLSDYAIDQDGVMSTAIGTDIGTIEDYGGGALYGADVVLVVELINELRDADWAILNAGLGAAANYTTQLGQTLTRLQAGLPLLQKVIFFKPDAVKATALGWNASAQARQDILWNATVAFVAANSSLCALGSTDWYEYSKTHDVGTNADVHGPEVGFHDLWGSYIAADINRIYDSVPPTIQSATTSEGGTQIFYSASERMGAGKAGIVPKINGTPVSVLFSSWSVDGLTLTHTLARGITGSDTVTFDYTPGDITDVAGNALAAISARSVTNHSSVSGGGGASGSRQARRGRN